ncbi:Protein of unknown function [Duganella sp. CF402]|uniref:DUF3999 family protein n=1 Tax=unclassified Duganella TaxID=2636909 RepID=UPI0008D0B406|nr:MULTISPECIES: DUF3999 family protein [unclassified Duganella]RZT06060.1 uncharacterized protein DUF3999 [Duganella sp. BK701]SEM77532.1 Protein of unknown function [Duganella sp. CF402]
MKHILIAAWAASTFAVAADSPQDYSHVLPLASTTRQGVLQVRLPKEVYLHSRSAMLDDVRVFDANGAALPFALRAPPTESEFSHRDLPLAVFPLMSRGGPASQLDLDVNTTTDGRLLSVKLKPDAGEDASHPQRLSALVMDLGKAASGQPLICALRFALPPDQNGYSAQVWLEVSGDMKRWDTIGAAELNWLVNRDAQTLVNDRLDFAPRAFRYARLSWRSGTPLQFASITAEQQVRTESKPAAEQLLLAPGAGRQPEDLMYAVPVGIAPEKVGLQFSEANVVLTGQIGVYREVPPRHVGQAGWRFDPLLNSTFYRITQGEQVRSSGDLEVAALHAPQWVLRTAKPAGVKPQLHLSWQPGTLVLLGNGNGPYLLAVGRERATPAASSIEQVAPGFSEAELQKLEYATVGPVRQQTGSGARDQAAELDAASATQRRLMVLWGVLVLGVAALGFMVWRLIRSSRS